MNKFIKSDIIKRAIENYTNRYEQLKLPDFVDTSDHILNITQTVYKEIVASDDFATKEAIRKYIMNKHHEENARIDFLDKEVVDEIINLGISEYIRRHR